MRRYKYPRTLHLPWSETVGADDRRWDRDLLEGREVVVTEKMDGENTTIYPDGTCHARSLTSASHPSRSYVRALAARVGHLLPDSYRVCGENLYARHSIAYTDLPDYFMVFSVWDDEKCLSWEETELWAQELELPLVPVLYRGVWPVAHESLWTPNQGKEGYVVRDAGSFHRALFEVRAAKFVRKNHVQTDSHWMHQQVTPNVLKKGN